MKLHESTRTIDEGAPHMRRISIVGGSGVHDVKALGDLSMEVAEGDLAGRRIEAFAWLEHVGDDLISNWEHQVNVTEARTGRCLARVPLLDHNQQPPDLTDDLVAAMTPTVLKGAAHVAFERFREADEDSLAEMFAYMDGVPSLPIESEGQPS
ncbi:hypothetical protein LY622_13710 [Halomonas sp. M5N1S17]|uniref:hypothetical protein n=1 Tax=Halomonas alkalisoli TaxID=2907158 RepID=UPI001F23B79F|nr:hypothetical protein [Halomonas alkalisoli]MCE9664490.1 hypothetical protein [Halomonas alkalisoli]